MKRKSLFTGFGVAALLLTVPVISSGCKTTQIASEAKSEKKCGCGKTADKCECKEGCAHDGSCSASH